MLPIIPGVVKLIDRNTIEQARSTDIVAFLERQYGYSFIFRSGSYRCRQHPSLAIKSDRLSWFWHSKGIGGFGALDFLVKIEYMPFNSAVETVTGLAVESASPPVANEKPKSLILPQKAGAPLRLYDYLCGKRCIDSGVVDKLINEGKLFEDERGNVVFVGHDELGVPRFASLRGTQSDFRGDCAGSDKRYSFNAAASTPSDQLYLYESATDLMSHSSIINNIKGDSGAWERCHRLSLAGTSDTAIPFFLNQHEEVKELVFCLDNDRPGRDSSLRLSKKYSSMGYYVRIEPPYGKDFNEDLVNTVRNALPENKRNIFTRNEQR